MRARRPIHVRRLLAVALMAAVVLSSAAGAALAGKPNRATSTASLAASCGPCAVGAVVDFSGTGYDAKQGKAMLNIGGAVTSTAVYADGTIRFSWPYFSSPGAYSVSVYQWTRSGKPVLKAQLTVTVS